MYNHVGRGVRSCVTKHTTRPQLLYSPDWQPQALWNVSYCLQSTSELPEVFNYILFGNRSWFATKLESHQRPVYWKSLSLLQDLNRSAVITTTTDIKKHVSVLQDLNQSGPPPPTPIHKKIVNCRLKFRIHKRKIQIYYYYYYCYYWGKQWPEGRGFDFRWCHLNVSLT
jgi:hypothetical protein